MHWLYLLAGFALSLFMGAAMMSLLATLRPHWSSARRRITAASVLPAVTVAATVLMIAFVFSSDHGQGETMEDLAIRAIAVIGTGLAVLALLGGLIGAVLVGRRRGA